MRRPAVVQEREVVRRLAGSDVAASSVEEVAQSIPCDVALRFGRIGLARVVDHVEGLEQWIRRRVQDRAHRDDLDVGAEDLLERPERVVPAAPSGEHGHLGRLVQLGRLGRLVRRRGRSRRTRRRRDRRRRARPHRRRRTAASRPASPRRTAGEGHLGHLAVHAGAEQVQDRSDLADAPQRDRVRSRAVACNHAARECVRLGDRRRARSERGIDRGSRTRRLPRGDRGSMRPAARTAG